MEIKSFSDIDNALKKVCELSVGIEKINGEVTLECNRIKESRKAEVERCLNLYTPRLLLKDTTSTKVSYLKLITFMSFFSLNCKFINFNSICKI